MPKLTKTAIRYVRTDPNYMKASLLKVSLFKDSQSNLWNTQRTDKLTGAFIDGVPSNVPSNG